MNVINECASAHEIATFIGPFRVERFDSISSDLSSNLFKNKANLFQGHTKMIRFLRSFNPALFCGSFQIERIQIFEDHFGYLFRNILIIFRNKIWNYPMNCRQLFDFEVMPRMMAD